MRVVCVANGKGGMFKTSLAAHVAGLSAAAGYRTLIVDLDPQGDLSDDLGYFDGDAERGTTRSGGVLPAASLPTALGVTPSTR